MVSSTCGQHQLQVMWPSGISHMSWVTNVLLELGSCIENKTFNKNQRQNPISRRRSRNLFWDRGSGRAEQGPSRLRWRALLLRGWRPQRWSVSNLSILARYHWPLGPERCSRWPSADLWAPPCWGWVSPLKERTKEVKINNFCLEQPLVGKNDHKCKWEKKITSRTLLTIKFMTLVYFCMHKD